MAVQSLVNAVHGRLRGSMAPVPIYDYRGVPHLEEADFPIVVTAGLAISNVKGFMGLAVSDVLGVIRISTFSLAAAGSAALRAVEEKAYKALHGHVFPAEDVSGYANVQMRCLSRGNVDVVDDRLIACADTFEIIGSEE